MSERRPFTTKESKLLGHLMDEPKRYTDLLRTGVYGNKGLSLALTSFLAVGLAERDGRRAYRLTEAGRKEVLRLRMVEALDDFLEDATYEEFAKVASELLVLLACRG